MAKLKIEASTVTPRQWALIAVLAVLLIGVLYWPANDAPADAPNTDLPAVPAVAGSAGARLPRARTTPPAEPKQWSQVSLDAALAHDPFAAPLLTAPPPEPSPIEPVAQEEQQENELLALKQDGVTMILRDAGGMVATVGDRKLRVGDVIDGYRVVAIELDGVVLERVKVD